MEYFAKPVLGRNQRVLIPTTLDDAIPPDHSVRILWEILGSLSWSSWKSEYCGRLGQPPIHPRTTASVLLYGLTRRIRSTRLLEDMTRYNIDFMWLTEGRTIDHSTLSKFRTRFKEQLRDLFRQLGGIAMAMGIVRLNDVTFDGTRVKANNDRYETWTQADVEKQLKELDDQFGEWCEESERNDVLTTDEPLPAELSDAKARQELLKRALEKLQAADAGRRSEGVDPAKNPAQLPSTDIDSKVLPNKEGGYAPNYTPLAAVDVHSEFIVYADVMQDTAENVWTLAMVDQVNEDFGQQPQAVLADGLHATGPNIVGMEQRDVEFLSPLSNEKPTANPAVRDDPTEAIAESHWPELPISPHTKKLDKSCFVFHAESDRYYCPMGHPLEFEKTKPDTRQHQKVILRVYRCHSCTGCPLASRCISEKSQGGRTITRDHFTPDRERHAAKMASAESQSRYQRRFHAGETPFGWLKHVLGLRQFLLRGLEKVKTEWLWSCTAYNMMKLIKVVGRLRAMVSSESSAVAV
jgi:transposase